LENILEVKDLKMHFITKAQTVKAVDGVTFNIKAGETFGLVGESGCGKSATCRTILRLLPESGKVVSGSIIYNGMSLLDLPESKMRKIRGKEIGMIFQEPMTSLNPVLKIKEQIYEQFIGSDMTNKEKYDRAIEMLKLVGIPSPERRIEEYIHQFSGGMRQRAMIAITLAAQPKILLADEPTTALDVTIQDQIIKLINKLKRELGMSIILVTHDLGVVSQMCDNVAVMYAGHIVEIADTLTLFSRPRHPYTQGLINSLPHNKGKNEKLISIQGAPPNLGHLPAGCPFEPRCIFKGERCVETLPEMCEVGKGHFSRCHYVEKMKDAKGLIYVGDSEGKGVI